ncbi:hypothetical protein HanRHA438_Chr01g0035861 [Helianthus annuus]|nr:hypothetical protein HanRHA438_Chr01g0035861 [Helianthus annuus]
MNVLDPKADGAMVVTYLPEGRPVWLDQIRDRFLHPTSESFASYANTILGEDGGDDLDDATNPAREEVIVLSSGGSDGSHEGLIPRSTRPGPPQGTGNEPVGDGADVSVDIVEQLETRKKKTLDKSEKKKKVEGSATEAPQIEQVGEGGGAGGDGDNVGARGGGDNDGARGGGDNVQEESSEATPHHTVYTKVIRDSGRGGASGTHHSPEYEHVQGGSWDTHNPACADLPHAPRWNLTQGSQMTDLNNCREFFSVSLPPAERLFQKRRNRLDLLDDHIHAGVNFFATSQEIAREWQLMGEDTLEFENAKKAFAEKREKFNAEKKGLA